MKENMINFVVITLPPTDGLGALGADSVICLYEVNCCYALYISF